MSRLDALPDEQLVELAVEAPEGDLRAFELLLARHQQSVITNCRYLSRSQQDAEDLAQEVFVKAYLGLKGFERRASFSTWVQRIKVNHCLNYLHKTRDTRAQLSLDDEATRGLAEGLRAPGAELEVTASDERAVIAGILDTLPDTLRVPLLMCDMDGLSYDEIAETLGLGLSAVKMRIKRGRDQFRRLYSAQWREGETETTG